MQHWKINRQAHHQTSTVEVESKLNNEPISIVIYLGASLSYISPRIVKMCKLHKTKFEKSNIPTNLSK
jgi:hypothetical protein